MLENWTKLKTFIQKNGKKFGSWQDLQKHYGQKLGSTRFVTMDDLELVVGNGLDKRLQTLSNENKTLRDKIKQIEQDLVTPQEISKNIKQLRAQQEALRGQQIATAQAEQKLRNLTREHALAQERADEYERTVNELDRAIVDRQRRLSNLVNNIAAVPPTRPSGPAPLPIVEPAPCYQNRTREALRRQRLQHEMQQAQTLQEHQRALADTEAMFELHYTQKLKEQQSRILELTRQLRELEDKDPIEQLVQQTLEAYAFSQDHVSLEALSDRVDTQLVTEAAYESIRDQLLES